MDDAIIFGEATGIALIAAVHCVGTESELFECSHGPLGVHLCYGRLEHVAVICYGKSKNHAVIKHTKT